MLRGSNVRERPQDWAVLVPAYTASGIWVVFRLSITNHFPADRALAPSLLGTVLLSPGICTPSLTLARGASGSPSLPSSEDARSQHEGRPTESRQIMTHDLLTTGFTCIFMCIFIDHGATNAWKRTTTTQNKRGFCAPPRVRPCSALCSRTHHEPRPKA